MVDLIQPGDILIEFPRGLLRFLAAGEDALPHHRRLVHVQQRGDLSRAADIQNGVGIRPLRRRAAIFLINCIDQSRARPSVVLR